MALHFNWNRLDLITADGLKELLNKKLTEVISPPLGTSHAGPGRDGSPSVTAEGGGGGGLGNIIESLEVDEISFGEVPPFVELLSISPAICFSPELGVHHSPSGGSSLTDSYDRGGGGGVRPSSFESTLSPADSISDATDVLQSSSRALSQSGTQHHPPSSEHQQQVDTLAPYLGPTGLFLKLHMTYGGDLQLRVVAKVRQSIELTPECKVVVRLPMEFRISQMRIDTYANINMHRNMCQFWLDEGSANGVVGSASPLQKLGLTAVIGGTSEGCCAEDADGVTQSDGGGDEGSNSNFYGKSQGGRGGPQISGSFSGGGGLGGERDLNKCVDAAEVGAFLLSELQAILAHRYVCPHYAQFPFVLPTP